MLQVPADGGRREEWAETLNPEAIVVSDRNSGTDASDHIMSVHTNRPGKWHGHITWNDNHSEFATTTHRDTRYGAQGALNRYDNLFESTDADDAMMIYSGP